MRSTTSSGIIVQDLSKYYSSGGARVDALGHVSFSVGRGEILGLLGVNGAGKSTLVRILSTLLRPDSGSALVNGFDVLRDPHGVRRSIGVALQDVGLDESRSVRRAVLMHARLHGLGRRESIGRVDELLEALGLQTVAQRRIRNLSGGVRRRLDLALALVHRPPVVFLDEPTVGLDPPSRMELWHQIEHLRAGGTTVLLTTQHLDEADRLADRIVILSQGRIAKEGSLHDLKGALGGSVLELGFAYAQDAESAAARLDAMGSLTGTKVRWPVADIRSLRIALAALHTYGLEPVSVSLSSPTLDDLFMQANRFGWQANDGERSAS